MVLARRLVCIKQSKCMEKFDKVQQLGKGHYRTLEGKEILFVRSESDPLEWEVRDLTEVVELSEKEKNKALMAGWDIEKVLEVKRLLWLNITPSEIKKRTGISRNSIYKYKKILSVKDIKKLGKDNQSTVISKSVLPKSLVFLVVMDESTISLFLVLTPLLVLAVVGYVKQQYDQWKIDLEEHSTIVRKMHFDFCRVFDLSFLKTPIIVNSLKEKTYYEKLLKHYNNQSRDVILVERGYKQSNHEHYDEKRAYESAYCSANRQIIDEAYNERSRIWNELRENGYLDYLDCPKKKNWKTSKHYLEKSLEFYWKNPLPVKDTARRKEIISDLDFLET